MKGTSKMTKGIMLLSLTVVLVFAHLASAQGTWETKAPMSTSRYYPGAAVFGGLLYVMGGCTAGICGDLVASTVEVYDPATNTWTPKVSMPTARGWLAAAEINGLIYAVGGNDPPLSALATLDVYDPVNNAWTTKAPMLTARAAPAVGTIGGQLFVAGGCTAGPCLAYGDALEVYDPVTDAWTAKAPMPTARAYSGAGVIDGKLYVVGGLSASLNVLTTLEAYDSETDTWTTKAPMPTARVAPGAGVINGKLYVVGGSNQSSSEPTLVLHNVLEVYDPATDSWTTETPMSTPRYGPGVAVINGNLYVAGGHNGSTPFDTLEVFTPVLQNPSNGHWYQRFDTSMTWHQARDFCDAKGGYLATITSQPENDFVYGTLASVSPQWTWLGATDEIAEGTWKWVTPEPFSYTNWAGGEPNNCNTENYLMYFTPGDPRAGFWNDLNTGPSSTGVPGGCGCGGCAGEWYPMSTICEWGGFCTKAPAGMVSWWTGDGNANDSVDGNHGTLNGAIFAQGKVGPAFTFDGIDDYVDVPDSESLDIATELTIDAWIMPLESKVHRVITKWGMAGFRSYNLDISADGRVEFYTSSDGTNFFFRHTAAGEIPVGQWTHVAAVYKAGAHQTIYVNGVPKDIASGGTEGLPSSLYNSTSPFRLARNFNDDPTPFFFNGALDEVEIFNRALTADDIKAIYLTGAAGKCINVTIDIRPGGFPNSINPFSRGVIPVAVVTTPVFDAATVDTTTVLFGPNGAAPVSSALQDFDLDGDLDLILQFRTQDTGIVCGTTSATLTGTTFQGRGVRGTDSVNTVGCR